MSRHDDREVLTGMAAAGAFLLLVSLILSVFKATVDRLDEIEACVCQCADEPEVPQ